MRDNRSFYSNWDWLSCLIYCCHSGEGALDALILLENKDLLTDALTYHVIPGEIMNADFIRWDD
jgi:hypothetical protein